jgi:phosphomannomutase
MVVAEYLGADAVVVPISCNDAIDRGRLAAVTEPKTRIGSPYVIAGMEQARAKGRRAVCGWEANGGFLLGSDIERDGRKLTKLATRDAFLPILCVLFAAQEQGLSLTELFARLPRRFSRAALLRNFPRSVSLEILKMDHLDRFFPPELGFPEAAGFDRTDGVRIRFANGDIAHIRPSGNADELRIYAVADTEERADAIAAMGVAEPDGILRRMERAVAR